MPLWAINDVTDYDAASDTGNISGGNIATYPATGGYELRTTEAVMTTPANYVSNALLVGATGGDLGKVTTVAAEAGGEVPLGSNVCGIVSSGYALDVYGQETVSFWPVYCPARA
jgi:propanediol dehydratase large subunit